MSQKRLDSAPPPSWADGTAAASMWIGAAIDPGDGDSGIKGAIMGTVAESAIRLLAPVVATYALGWAVQYGVAKGWKALTGNDPSKSGRLRAA